MLINGLVIDVGTYNVTVMTKDNAYFRLIRKPYMFVSQEIEFKDSDIIGFRYLAKRLSAVAACFLIIFYMAFYFGVIPVFNTGTSEDFAYLSLDMKSSLEFAVDSNENVLKVESINGDKQDITKGMKLEGMKISNAFNKIIEKCREKGVGDTGYSGSLLVSGLINSDNKEFKEDAGYADEKLTKMLDEIKVNVDNVVKGEQDTIVLKLKPEERNLAKDNNISLGRYAVFSELNKLGKKVSIEEVKKASIEELVTAYVDLKEDSIETPKPVSTATPTLILALTLNSAITVVTPLATPTPAIANSTLTRLLTSPKTITTTPKLTSTLRPSQTPVPIQAYTGTGLRGEYYDNIDLTNFKFSRNDPVINFGWGFVAPDPRVRNDGTYSVRWTGQIQPLYSEEYIFYTTHDNGVKLWVDNKLIINEWNDGWNTISIGKIVLTGGRKYDIRIEYFNNTGNGYMVLEWSSMRTFKSVVPKSCLYPSESPIQIQETIQGNGTGLSYKYYDNDDLTNLKVTGVDPTIDFNWGYGSPDMSIIPDQKFSISWTGEVQPLYSEEYIFYVTHDGGVRLSINGQLVINNWYDAVNVSKTVGISLKAGQKYSIKLEYYNSYLTGYVKLEWTSPSTIRSVVPQACLFP